MAQPIVPASRTLRCSPQHVSLWQMVDENNLAALQAPLVCKFFSAGNTSKGTTDFTRRAEPDGTKERVTFPAPVVHEPLLKQLDGTDVSHLAAWRPTELVSAETARIRTMCSRLINAPLWVLLAEDSPRSALPNTRVRAGNGCR